MREKWFWRTREKVWVFAEVRKEHSNQMMIPKKVRPPCWRWALAGIPGFPILGLGTEFIGWLPPLLGGEEIKVRHMMGLCVYMCHCDGSTVGGGQGHSEMKFNLKVRLTVLTWFLKMRLSFLKAPHSQPGPLHTHQKQVETNKQKTQKSPHITVSPNSKITMVDLSVKKEISFSHSTISSKNSAGEGVKSLFFFNVIGQSLELFLNIRFRIKLKWLNVVWNVYAFKHNNNMLVINIYILT